MDLTDRTTELGASKRRYCSVCGLIGDEGAYHLPTGWAVAAWCGSCGTQHVIEFHPAIPQGQAGPWCVRLESSGVERKRVMKLLRGRLNIGLTEVKRLIGRAPVNLKESRDLQDLEALREELRALGAEVTSGPVGSSAFVPSRPRVEKLLAASAPELTADVDGDELALCRWALTERGTRCLEDSDRWSSVDEFTCHHCGATDLRTGTSEREDCPSCRGSRSFRIITYGIS